MYMLQSNAVKLHDKICDLLRFILFFSILLVKIDPTI